MNNEKYTVKDIAELIGVSKTTIQRTINSLSIIHDEEDKQTRYYEKAKVCYIISKVKPNFDLSVLRCGDTTAPTDTNTATTAPTTETTDTNTATQPQQTEIELLRDMITTIQEQLKVKDKQIEEYQNIISSLNEQNKEYSIRLKEAMNLTQGQQYITAVDKTLQLQSPIDINNNNSLWNKILNKLNIRKKEND